ncbi:MAG: Coproporphyrinogen oxidase [Crocinitomicaceae bacterium]|jgi:coproporphyrinogen III oxidase|nr:Coproporphyrinogen oxidase [Crocinitomicaceae bacterium]
MTKEHIAESFRGLQLLICKGLEELDGGASFQSDAWKREEGGGGFTNTIANGALLEKGGVAFSEVYGPVSDEMKKQLNLQTDPGTQFYATGVSLVLHPFNPHVPIIHMNVRYFEMGDAYWFGGGIDLTPHYIVPAQARLFHEKLQAVCDRFSPSFYTNFKTQADHYFFIPHRNETRGIGGIFYDHLSEKNAGLSKGQLLEFALELGRNFVPIYAEQANLGRELPFSPEELKWRNLRRGRYVEFNLVNDRGTKFGLHSGGRTESILMSLPAEANWEYGFVPEEGSREAATLGLLKKDISWLEM